MERAVLLLIFVSLFVVPGFLAGLISGRAWTRWLSGVLVTTYFVIAVLLTHPGRLIVIAPAIVAIGGVGFCAAELGRYIRRTSLARRRTPPGEVNQLP